MENRYRLKTKPLDSIVLANFNPDESDGIVNYWVPQRRYLHLASEVIKAASGLDDPLVVDLGCGSGLCTKLLADLGLRVRGIDNDNELIKNAKQTYISPNLDYDATDIEKLNDPPKSKKIGKVQGFYCSFMPENENWTPLMESFNPDVIIHVLENVGERFTTGSELSYQIGRDYEFYGDVPLVSYWDLTKLDSLSQEIMATGMLILVKKGIPLKRLIDLHGAIGQLDAKYEPEKQYPWEIELERRIKETTKLADF